MKYILSNNTFSIGSKRKVFSDSLYTVYDDLSGEVELVKGSVLLSEAAKGSGEYGNLDFTAEELSYTIPRVECDAEISEIMFFYSSSEARTHLAVPLDVSIKKHDSEGRGYLRIGDTKLPLWEEEEIVHPMSDCFFRPNLHVPYTVYLGDGQVKECVDEDMSFDSIFIENVDYCDGVIYGELQFYMTLTTRNQPLNVKPVPIVWDMNNKTVCIDGKTMELDSI